MEAPRRVFNTSSVKRTFLALFQTDTMFVDTQASEHTSLRDYYDNAVSIIHVLLVSRASAYRLRCVILIRVVLQSLPAREDRNRDYTNT